MKIYSIHPSTAGGHNSVWRVTRMMVFCGAAWMCVTLAGMSITQAQTSSGGLRSSGEPVVKNGLFSHGDQTFKVVNTAGFRTSADVGATEAGSIAQVSGGYGMACSSCGTSSCGGSCGQSSYVSGTCGSCGNACGGRCGQRRNSALTCNFDLSNACAPCIPYRYAMVESVWMGLEESNFSISPNFGMNDFDYEFAPRITIGSVGDCVHGYEVSFTGPLEWNMQGSLSSNNNDITLFIPSLTPTGLTRAAQRLDAEYMSFEANKTLVGWEMAKLLIGGRYISYDEDYSYIGTSNIAPTGTNSVRSLTDNQLFGLQVGMDLLFPVGVHAYSDMRARAGAYYNSADTDFRVVGNSTTTPTDFRNRSDEGELAGMFEIGTGMRYQIGEMLAVRGGVELWYLSGVATATDQFRASVGPNTGRRIRVDDDILITGLSFGAELRW